MRLNKFHLRIPDRHKTHFESGRNKLCSTIIKVQSSKTSGGYFLTDESNNVRLSRLCLKCLKIYGELQRLHST